MDARDPAAGASHAGEERSPEGPAGRRRRGRPKGSRNKAKLALEAVFEEAAEPLRDTIVAKALAEGGAMLRFCVGLMFPARRDHAFEFDLPEIADAGDLAKAGQALLADCARVFCRPRRPMASSLCSPPFRSCASSTRRWPSYRGGSKPVRRRWRSDGGTRTTDQRSGARALPVVRPP